MLAGGLFASFGLGTLAVVTFVFGAFMACAVAWGLFADHEAMELPPDGRALT